MVNVLVKVGKIWLATQVCFGCFSKFPLLLMAIGMMSKEKRETDMEIYKGKFNLEDHEMKGRISNRRSVSSAGNEIFVVQIATDGCIVCPSTDSTYDLRTGEVKDWYPKNVVLRVLTPSLRPLFVYSVKLDADNIYISLEDGVPYGASAEIVFSGKAQPGATASDVNVDEVRMIVDEGETGFGFTKRNELINGKTAAIGFLLLLDFELLTGKGLLKGTGGHSFFTAYGLWLQQYSLQQLSNSVAKLV
ncbi:hypothetical protein IFM89_006863 [Coptis chinensis]|uniref:Uncharacterized protein n=1 Tax=Coptis chinensis TaxID=261450 RepID=A0A835GV76_9MAGN|nr:hypothetical protein IFM89_006863 [Coptis chinensis]